MKKKKLKINVHRPVGTRVKYDDEGNIVPPLAALGDIESGDSVLQPEKGMILELFSSFLSCNCQCSWLHVGKLNKNGN